MFTNNISVLVSGIAVMCKLQNLSNLNLVRFRDGNRTLLLKFGFGSVRSKVRVRFGSTIIIVRVRFGSVRSKVRVRFDLLKLGDSKTTNK